jgi:hypothetical protein
MIIASAVSYAAIRGISNGTRGRPGVRGLSAGEWIGYILWEFFNRRDELRAEADAIRAGIQSRALPGGRLDMAASPVPIAAEVEIEHQHATSFEVNPSDVPRIAQRAESPMYSDAWVKDRNLLIEAKSAQGRDALRQAIGQLYDYRRFHNPDPALAVLLAYEPTGDRGALLHSASIATIWPKPRGPGFRDTAGGHVPTSTQVSPPLLL